MIECFELALPDGIRLSVRACGPAQAPRVVFLHGFPEGAFIWDETMLALSGRFRCLAPNLRGYAPSSAPQAVDAYRARQLTADIAVMIVQTGPGPVAALVGHDWGGAVSWNLAVQRPELMRQLVVINSPHPGTFLRELQLNPAQQQASAYMNYFCRPDAEAQLAAQEHARLLALFRNAQGQMPDWLDEGLQQRYLALWQHGLTGLLNYYRASPMRPPTSSDAAVLGLSFAPELVTVKLPTLVIWGEEDRALLPSLLNGLGQF
ncbi:MAG: alpha/beta hydrolase, partial [Paucibacter sp.]|nr:alpha/beta hydrolase [Roseateles sp.]